MRASPAARQRSGVKHAARALQPVIVTRLPGDSARAASKNRDEVPLFAMSKLQPAALRRLQSLRHRLISETLEDNSCRTCRRCALLRCHPRCGSRQEGTEAEC
jgi:hypothetical protein